MKARKWILAHNFEGFPKDSDLEIVDEELPALQDGSVLFEAVYFTVDPYMRPYSRTLKPGSTMLGEQVARVAESRNAKYEVGKLFLLRAGWRDKTVVNPDDKVVAPYLNILPAPDTGNYPQSLAVGLLGMPGLSAYFGFLRICDPKPGETVYVNSAAGIVGSTVGQIAKIKGCRVIASAGTDAKCSWLKDELGFDYVFNYKNKDVNETLKEAAPQGIDCFFDNVGDQSSISVITNHMNRYGRVSCCGAISQYNESKPPTGPMVFHSFISKELKMQGFLITSFAAERQSALDELKKWLDEGKLKYREDVLNGFENLRSALYGLLSGKFTGKVVVKV